MSRVRDVFRAKLPLPESEEFYGVKPPMEGGKIKVWNFKQGTVYVTQIGDTTIKSPTPVNQNGNKFIIPPNSTVKTPDGKTVKTLGQCFFTYGGGGMVCVGGHTAVF